MLPETSVERFFSSAFLSIKGSLFSTDRKTLKRNDERVALGSLKRALSSDNVTLLFVRLNLSELICEDANARRNRPATEPLASRPRNGR